VVPDAPEATRRLAEAGIAAFRTPETAADGLRAFLRWTAPHPPALMRDDVEHPAIVNRTLHAGQAMQIFRMLGVTIPTMLWVRRDAEVPRALPFPPPYVVKVLSPELEHRLDIGGVALGIETITGVQAAAATVTQRVQAVRPDVFLDGVMIQRLERGLAEVSIGFRRDKEAGPIVTLSMGEGLGETYGDRALRLAPLDRAQAYDMIDEVKGLTRIRGHRGRPRGDLEALAHSLVAISSFALIASPRVVEATIDPVLIKPEGQGVVALDGWMKTE
jgi:acyl-CoA synthetase (NDP forming)